MKATKINHASKIKITPPKTPSEAALAAAKILALSDKNLQNKIKEYHEQKRKEIIIDDNEVMQNG